MTWTEDLYKDYYDGVWGNYTSFTWSNNTFNWEDWIMNAVIFNDDTTISTECDLDRRTITGNKRLQDITYLNSPDETFSGDTISDFNEEA